MYNEVLKLYTCTIVYLYIYVIRGKKENTKYRHFKLICFIIYIPIVKGEPVTLSLRVTTSLLISSHLHDIKKHQPK